MPNIITIDTWKVKLQAIPFYTQSPELKFLTTAFTLYSTNASQSNIAKLDVAFKAWDSKISPQVAEEKRKLGTTKADLAHTIAQANPLTKNLRSSVRPVGWLLVAWTRLAYSWTSPVVPPNKQAPLTGPQISRVNEAFRRAKAATELARDTMIAINKTKQFSAPVGGNEKLYQKYFGQYDETRFRTVLENFQVLALAFGNEPNVVDLRNTTYGVNCYAACFRTKLGTRGAKKHDLSLTGKVDIFLGRHFFAGGGYAGSTDATVGTLVHEFAHGAINAVDAPPVNPDDSWRLQPKHHPGNPLHNDYGESPNNSIQASTPGDDAKLALKEPAIAIRNADCYGQFSKDVLLRIHK